MARDPGQRQDLKRTGTCFDHVQAGALSDCHAFQRQCIEDLDRVRAPGRRRDIVIADQDEDRQASPAQAQNAAGELALVGRVGCAILIHIAGDQYRVSTLGQPILDRFVQPVKVVDQPGVHAAGWVEPAVIFHANVQVG
jgi:hypothetical protein